MSDRRVPFGRYAGEEIAGIPDAYLVWLAHSARNVPPDVRLAVCEELRARGVKGDTTPIWPPAWAACEAGEIEALLRRRDRTGRLGDAILNLLRDLAAAGVRLRAANGHVFVLNLSNAGAELRSRLTSSFGILQDLSQVVTVDAEQIAGIQLPLPDPATLAS